MDEETYKKILIALADHREATQYEIAKEARLTYAPVHQAIERLLLAALIEEVRTEVGQGPLPKRYFRLTFPGLMTVLNFFLSSTSQFGSSRSSEENTQDELDSSDLFRKKSRAALMVQRDFYPQIKFFSEWEFLEGVFDFENRLIPGLYNVLDNAVTVCIHKFRPLEKADLVEEKLKSKELSFSEYGFSGLWFESWFYSGLASKWSNLTTKERLAAFKENFLPEYRSSLNKQMQRLFVRAFFNGLMNATSEVRDPQIDLRRTGNKALFEFASSYFEKEKSRKLAFFKRFNEEGEFILNLFAV
jgi:hypothetical protein